MNLVSSEVIKRHYQIDEKPSKTSDDSYLNGLDIGDYVYLKGSYNLFKKVNSDQYKFIRKDHIETVRHKFIKPTVSREDVEDATKRHFAASAEYSQDRVDVVSKMLDDVGDNVTDFISSTPYIKKEHKDRTSLRSGEDYDNYVFERMANYILSPKFKDLHEEEKYNNKREKLDKLRKIYPTGNKEVDDLRDEIDLFNQSMITFARQERNEKREDFFDDIDNIEQANPHVNKEFSHDKMDNKRLGEILDIDDGYWERMGFQKVKPEIIRSMFDTKDSPFTDDNIKFRQEVLYEYERTIENLKRQVGYHLPFSERKEFMANSVKKLSPVTYENVFGEIVTLSPSERFGEIRRIYSETVTDYYIAKESLVDYVKIKPVDNKTVYDWSTDTWYNDGEKDIFVSRNTINWSNPNTYKGLILNYFDLKEEYFDKPHNDMWAILFTFEDILTNTDLTEEELFVVDMFIKDFSRENILYKFEEKFNKSISQGTLSNWINKSIPNKLLNTYLKSVDEWLYTYKIKGKFKKCSSCEEIKLISNDRYFGKDSRNPDGFQSICKRCDRHRKTLK